MKRVALLVLFSFCFSTITPASTFDVKCLNLKGEFSNCKVDFDGSKITLKYKTKANESLNEEILGQNIKSIGAGEYSRRRVGEAVGTAVFTFGIGALLLLSKKKREHYGVEYTAQDGSQKSTGFEVKKKYHVPFEAALKAVSGKDITREAVAAK